MKMKFVFPLLMGLTLGGLALPVFAQTVEIAVQGSTDAGGGATQIVGRVNGDVRFSVTGNFNDIVGVKDCTGKLLFERSVRDLWNGNVGPLQMISRQQLPDGNSRIIMVVKKASPIFNGGAVRLRSGNRLLDEDPIILK
jgi:hypothetical protein